MAELPPVPLTLEGSYALHQMFRFRRTAWREKDSIHRDRILAQASAALTDYLLDQAFHLTVVQEQPPMVGVKALTGVEVDPLFNVRYADAKLAS